VLCAALVLPCVPCAVRLTCAAGNGGWSCRAGWGRVSRVQVLFTGARTVPCAALVVPCVPCAVRLTCAAGKGGWFCRAGGGRVSRV
jgi:hypothetical protein